MHGGPALSRPVRAFVDRLLPALLFGAITALLVLPGPAGALPASGSGSHTLAIPASLHVSAAERSFLAGVGPGAGFAGCSVTGSSVACSASPAAAPRPAASGPVMPASWTDLTAFAGGPPTARYIASLVWDPVDNYVLLFGGFGSSGAMSDSWAFADGQWTQLSPGTNPDGRYATTMAWDAVDNYVVLFGGYNGASVWFNDTWTFVHGAWTNITGTTNQTPEGRWRHSMTWDAADGYVLMFGGTNSAGTALSDTWSFVKGNWTKLTVTGSPPGRYRASMAYDALDGYAVLFGGCTTVNCPDSATWTYHNLTWTSVSPSTHPSARIYFGITYSPIYQHILLFGGSSSAANSPLSDTWAYANGTWTDITTNLSRSPSARPYIAMAFDPTDNYSIIFGGQWTNGTYIDETWALGPSILGRLTVSPGTIDLGQTASVNATPYAYSGFVSYNYTQLPTGCLNQNLSPLSCTPTSIGTYPLSVVLNDSSGSPVTETGSLGVNSDPVITGFTVSKSTVTRGVPVQFDVSASSGTGSYTYHYTGLPPGCATSNVDNLTCTPSGSASGAYAVNVKVTDQAAFSVNQTLTLTVNPPPSLSTLVVRPAVLDVGQSFGLWANLTPRTGTGPYSYVYTGLPSSCSTANAPVLTCSPGAAGSSFIIVTVTDSFGFSTTGSTNVTVNAPPQITSSAVLPTPVDVGTPITFWVNASGGTGSLAYSYVGSVPGCTFGNRTQITCTPTSAGSYTVTAKATDQVGFSASTTLTFVINPGYESSGLGATPGSLDVGQNLSLVFATTGGTGPYSYTWSGLPTGCVGGTGPNLTCAPRAAGTFAISVTGTDRWHATVSGGVQVIVNPAPSVSAFTASANPATQGDDVDLSVAIAGGSGVYTIQYTGLPAGCTSANQTVLHCTPSATGSFNVTVTVTDSLGARTTSYLDLSINSPSSGAGPLGSSTTLYLLIAVVVVVVVIAAVVLLMRRRPRAPAEESAPASDTEGTYSEPPAQ